MSAAEVGGRAQPSWLAATLPVLDLATTSLETFRSAAVAAGLTGPAVTAPLDPGRVAASFGSDRLFRDGGRPAVGFAPLSGFFPAADGWVRTHANYPHHARRLVALLGCAPDPAAVADALVHRGAADLESAAVRVGAVLVRVRSESEWRREDAARALAGRPPVLTTLRGEGRPVRLTGGPRPLTGVRVLDLTRVIAGPVCTRALALLGADVLRIDPPDPAEIGWHHLDTGQGKRSALLDLRTDRDHAQQLIDEADVLVTGYRPGAIEAFGLRLPPGSVHARVNAWGDAGPWALRRGFDSVVQAASGIAMVESTDGRTPGALPAQALDHASGYLLAAGIVRALVDRSRDGRGRETAVALARTAAWLLDGPGRTPDHGPPLAPGAVVTYGERTTAPPAVPGFDDHPEPAHPWGSDPATW